MRFAADHAGIDARQSDVEDLARADGGVTAEVEHETGGGQDRERQPDARTRHRVF